MTFKQANSLTLVQLRWLFIEQMCPEWAHIQLVSYKKVVTAFFDIDNLVQLLKQLSNSRQIWQNFKITLDKEKYRDHFLDDIFVHKLAKFQLFGSFWSGVITIFVKYQKIPFFCYFLAIVWPKPIIIFKIIKYHNQKPVGSGNIC